MTSESTQAAKVIDEFPLDLRMRLRDAVIRIADTYRITCEIGWPPQERAQLPAGVIDLSARRASRT